MRIFWRHLFKVKVIFAFLKYCSCYMCKFDAHEVGVVKVVCVCIYIYIFFFFLFFLLDYYCLKKWLYIVCISKKKTDYNYIVNLFVWWRPNLTRNHFGRDIHGSTTVFKRLIIRLCVAACVLLPILFKWI